MANGKRECTSRISIAVSADAVFIAHLCQLLHCCAARHTRRPLKAFGSSAMVDAMAYSVRRTPSSRARPVGWNNSFRYSLGLRYDPTRQWSLRLGTAYDETPGPSDVLRTPASRTPTASGRRSGLPSVIRARSSSPRSSRTRTTPSRRGCARRASYSRSRCSTTSSARARNPPPS